MRSTVLREVAVGVVFVPERGENCARYWPRFRRLWEATGVTARRHSHDHCVVWASHRGSDVLVEGGEKTMEGSEAGNSVDVVEPPAATEDSPGPDSDEDTEGET